jgi:predicted dehydrogenase
VSCSYGPGRYDSQYEEQGHDYPVGFVRWTEQRNFEAFLDMLSHNLLNITPLISHRIDFSEAEKAYELLTDTTLKLGILLTYDHKNEENLLPAQTIQLNTVSASSSLSIGMVGAGNYANRVLIPAFKKASAQFHTIACNAGISGAQAGKKYGFAQVTTDVNTLFSQRDINTVVVASRHDTHAEFVCAALQNMKNVFVEKPLCLTLQELDEIKRQYKQTPQLLMVGFNRRFAPHIQKIKSLLNTVSEPKSFIMTVNAGEIPAAHWTQDISEGGGRIIGEACHFIDLLRFLAGSTIISYQITRMENVPMPDDKLCLTLNFQDGSFGVIHYLANGHRSFPKERLEIFTAGKILQLDNFRKLRGFGWHNFKRMNLFQQDKGQNECVRHFMNAVKFGLPAPISPEEIFEVASVTIQIANTLKNPAAVNHEFT